MANLRPRTLPLLLLLVFFSFPECNVSDHFHTCEQCGEGEDGVYPLPNDQWAELRREQIERTRARKLASAMNGTGWWSTRGSEIIDANGNQIFFSGINWDGFEYESCVIDGIAPGMNRTILGHLRQMRNVGFNVIRLPFAGSCIQPKVYPKKGSVDYDYNLDLVNLTSFEIYAKVVRMAGEMGFKIFLDYHRMAPPFYPTYGLEAGLWYNATYPVSFWLDTWRMMVHEFVNESYVVGVDLFNEPHPDPSHADPVWLDYDLANGSNWRTAARDAGNMIQGINPNLLICVQGLYQGTWYAGYLGDVMSLPLNLTVENKLVYSIHEYGPLVREQPWHHTKDYPDNLEGFWYENWAFVHEDNFAPVWIGEFGSLLNQTPNAYITEEQARLRSIEEIKWLVTFVNYIKNQSLVWTFFDWGPNALDTGGILLSDWTTIDTVKLGFIKPIMYPNFALPASPPSPPLSPPSPPILGNGPLSYTMPPINGTLAPIQEFASPPPPDLAGPPSSTGGGIMVKVSTCVIGFIVVCISLVLMW